MSRQFSGQVVALRLPSVRLAAIDQAKTPKQNSPKRESPSQWTRNVPFDFSIHPTLGREPAQGASPPSFCPRSRTLSAPPSPLLPCTDATTATPPVQRADLSLAALLRAGFAPFDDASAFGCPGNWSPITAFRGHIENARHFWQPTAMAMGHSFMVRAVGRSPGGGCRDRLCRNRKLDSPAVRPAPGSHLRRDTRRSPGRAHHRPRRRGRTPPQRHRVRFVVAACRAAAPHGSPCCDLSRARWRRGDRSASSAA